MAMYAATLALFLTAFACALVGPNSLGSDLSILFYNDLSESASPWADSGVILLDPMPLDKAKRSCQALGETLWASGSGFEHIQHNMRYLVFQQRYNLTQMCWVSPVDGKPTTITADGKTDTASADAVLPVLCTQSALYSTPQIQDTDPRWQVAVYSNSEYITGFRDRRSFRFLGVRYGEYSKRWTHSRVYKGNGSAASALDYAPMCLQVPGGSEDCLFLNIWTPHLPKKENSHQYLRPVMIWFHGGEYRLGSGNDPNFDGGNLASRGDVVVVTVNYRLGTLGFLALDDGHTNGNYGLGDQFTALDWVRRHIHDFGGDSNRITVFGESSGASTGRVMLFSPRALGKFSGMIMQSNPGGIGDATSYSKYYTIEQEMKVAGNTVLDKTNCTHAPSQIECLRSLPVSAILEVIDLARYIVIDGDYVQASELDLYHPDPSAIANVPLMIGMARDDSAVAISVPPTGENIHDLLARAQLPAFITPSHEFPIPNSGNRSLDIFNTSARIVTDATMRCLNQATAYAGFNKGIFSDIFFYEFNRTYQMPEWSPNPPLCEAPITPDHPYGDPSQEYFKCHQGELYYAFGNIQYLGRPLRDEFDLPFEQYVVDAWTSFAHTGDPNPDIGMLKARSYINTMRQIEMAGPWTPFRPNDYRLHLLQWPSSMMGLNELDQCRVLNMSLHMYDV